MRAYPFARPGPLGRVVGFVVALLPPATQAAAPTPDDPGPPAVTEAPAGELAPPGDAPPSPPGEATPPTESPLPADVPADGTPAIPTPSVEPVVPGDTDSNDETPKKKPPTADGPAPAVKPKKGKKAKKKAEPHKVNQGTEYRLGLFPTAYVEGRSLSVGVNAGVRQRLEPKKNHAIVLGLNYEYEPFSTRTLGFPEEDETTMSIKRTLVQPMHILAAQVSRQIAWGKLVTTSIDLTADAWWPAIRSQQRLSARMTPGVRIGRSAGPFGELSSELYYKKFPNYYIDSVMRRIDQEGVTPTALVGYNHRKLVRASAGFAFDFTHYLDAHYNAIAADGTYVRSDQTKNYLDYIPFADLLVRPVRGLRIRARYAFERQKTQHYDRVMTGRDEFASLTAKFFQGYYDYRRHQVNLWISWEFRQRLRLAAAATAWVRHFDVYEARTADNFWTGQLRLDAEVEGSVEVAVRVHTIERRKMKHDFFISLLGSHVSRTSNMKRQISLATNFDISRVLLGFEVRGR